MPTYEYHCDACEHHFDEFQSMSDKPLKKCPQCGKPKLRRIFGTGAAIIFKGSGFYETDYRSESYKAGAKAEQDATKPADKDAAKPADAGKSTTTDTKSNGSTEKAPKPAKKSSSAKT
jgi:putative FmdB family regulatory protein